MKQLIIVRHGKSDWEDGSLADIDRPLKKKGVNDAYTMAKKLKDKGFIPDIILSSPATRAISTALIMARGLKVPASKISIRELIYFKEEDDILEEIKLAKKKFNTIMIVGHNPAFTGLVNFFIKQPIDNLPTTGIAVFNFKIKKWEGLKKGQAFSECLFYPKNN